MKIQTPRMRRNAWLKAHKKAIWTFILLATYTVITVSIWRYALGY